MTERKIVTRRRFLTGLGVAGAAAATGWRVSVWGRDDDAPIALPATTTTTTTVPEVDLGIAGRTLVIVEMAGGNDALNTVVPHADPRYRDLRPTLAVAEPIDLDGEIGLHPALGNLANAWSSGDLAIVEGVGIADPDLSHFASLLSWWTAVPGSPGGSGWVGRYLDATVGFDDPLAGVTIGRGPSPALAGEQSFATAISGPDGLRPGLPIDDDVLASLMGQWAAMAPAHLDSTDPTARVADAIRSTVDAAKRLDDALVDDTAGSRGAPRNRTGLTTSLDLAVQLAASDQPPRVVWVQFLGDFDTHQGQGGRHPQLMEELDAGIATYLDAVAARSVGDRVVLMTTSEFGRRPAENGTGTDHGTASTHLVLGSPVAGGRHGGRPSLAALDDTDNMVATVPHVDYYASLLEGWLGVDPEPILGPTTSLPLIA